MSGANNRGSHPAHPGTREEPHLMYDGTVLGTNAVTHAGLTIREHLAAMAMQGLLAYFGDDDQSHEVTARSAVLTADALLAELAKVRP